MDLHIQHIFFLEKSKLKPDSDETSLNSSFVRVTGQDCLNTINPAVNKTKANDCVLTEC